MQPQPVSKWQNKWNTRRSGINRQAMVFGVGAGPGIDLNRCGLEYPQGSQDHRQMDDIGEGCYFGEELPPHKAPKLGRVAGRPQGDVRLDCMARSVKAELSNAGSSVTSHV
eukprot:NODE_3201_length_585_cov_5.147388_g2687_i0.p1 GENE.NODE_3201_length_585_cov_5.147388_g2687_i0~~NODE_3201_length_585_cov_5.147388_g2687_i0.p1  ORF type:complete len:111 (-),score=9.85 NODE_3201_length_585_cov_5.147388_g2687_i0:117-449(-)